MKRTKLIILSLTIALGFTFQGCLKEEYQTIKSEFEENIKANDFSDFDFKTINQLDFTLKTYTPDKKPIVGVPIQIFSKKPLLDNGIIKPEAQQFKVFSGATTQEGMLNCKINLANYSDSLFILCNYIGLNRLTSLAITSNQINLQIGNNSVNSQFTNSTPSNSSLKSTQSNPNTVNGYYTLGNWNSSGVPNYLEPENDIIENQFLEEINASLPESIRLTQSHPQYLANNNDANLAVSEECEIWVTFVHEGAGWRNVLGYYTYPINNPPTSKNEINDLTIIFPNVSYLGGGGGLRSGNKVQLKYLDPNTNTYTDFFPANTSIGWFLIAQGWSNQTIGSGVYTHYSDIAFNIEQDPDLKKHNVLLYDEQRELLLMGFEDIRRDANSDEDFNDAVFYTTITPFSAVNTSFYQPTDTPIDSDGDGITDVFDEFPNDDSKAFRNHYPGENQYGTLVFEDLWPYKGDYDFNDLVIDYNFNQQTNSQNQVTALQSKIVVKAIGASYHNGFGIQLNILPEDINQVTGQRLTKSYINTNSNGTESQQSNATVIYFDDAFNNLSYPGTGIGVNTSRNAPYVEPDTQIVNINFTNPLNFSKLGTPPYNPFMIIDGDRSVEVHLPNMSPTDLANKDLLGTGDDDSNSTTGEYYVSDYYLPWAINIPVSFDYPYEKEDITEAHLQFTPWAISRGYNYMDWYINQFGYRNNEKIYTK